MGCRRIKSQSATPTHGRGLPAAFTLIELLVVIAIIALLTSITLPVAAKARQKVKHLLNKINMKEITRAQTLYGTENNDNCSPSLAYIRTSSGLTPSDPRILIATDTMSPTQYSAQSEYLGGYIPNAKIIYCPNAPKFKYLQKMWDAGNAWDHPELGTKDFLDPFRGAYCFLWNYTGRLENGRFTGATTITRRRGESEVMVTDYFGRNNHRSSMYALAAEPDVALTRISYGSCERFKHATPTEPNREGADFWRSVEPPSDILTLHLQAGLINGSVKDYTPAEADVMKVGYLGNQFPGYGDYFIPR